MLAVDAGEEPVEKEEVELLLDPKVFRCRWRTVGVKFDRLLPPTTAADAKALAIALKYLLKRYPSLLRGAPGRLHEEYLGWTWLDLEKSPLHQICSYRLHLGISHSANAGIPLRSIRFTRGKKDKRPHRKS